MSEPNLSVPSFTWRRFGIERELPHGWVEEITACALKNMKEKFLTPTSVTSYEADTGIRIPVMTVGGRIVKQTLPWLFSLYTGTFLDYAQAVSNEPVFPAKDERYGVNLNIQIGRDMRYECHVDSNPIEGLLYVTTHPEGSGGELRVSNNPDAHGPDEINIDCVIIYPERGTLVFFDARRNPHYITPLKRDADMRIVATMNYYTPSCTEEMRPADLNKHLGLSE
jgi:hypothetical protein